MEIIKSCTITLKLHSSAAFDLHTCICRNIHSSINFKHVNILWKMFFCMKLIYFLIFAFWNHTFCILLCLAMTRWPGMTSMLVYMICLNVCLWCRPLSETFHSKPAPFVFTTRLIRDADSIQMRSSHTPANTPMLAQNRPLMHSQPFLTRRRLSLLHLSLLFHH